jgi:hypothetical protein
MDRLIKVLDSLGGDEWAQQAAGQAQQELGRKPAGAKALPLQQGQDGEPQQGRNTHANEELAAAAPGSIAASQPSAPAGASAPAPASAPPVAAPTSNAGVGTPSDFWSMAVPDIQLQADRDHSGSISASELSRLLFGYGLRVGDDLARQLIIRHNGLASPDDVASLQLFLQECWDAMLDALPEGYVADEGQELVLSKRQCAYACRQLAGNKRVEQVMAGVGEDEELSYSLLVGLVLQAQNLHGAITEGQGTGVPQPAHAINRVMQQQQPSQSRDQDQVGPRWTATVEPLLPAANGLSNMSLRRGCFWLALRPTLLASASCCADAQGADCSAAVHVSPLSAGALRVS